MRDAPLPHPVRAEAEDSTVDEISGGKRVFFWSEWLNTADIIVGQRACQPGATLRWQQMAREGRCALVYEVDDDLLDVDPSNGPAWSFFAAPRSGRT